MIMKNVSTSSNAKGLGESIGFSFIINSLVFHKDIGLDLSLSLDIDIVISVHSSLVLLDNVILGKLAEHCFILHIVLAKIQVTSKQNMAFVQLSLLLE